MMSYTYTLTVRVPEGNEAGDVADAMGGQLEALEQGTGWTIGAFELTRAEGDAHIATYVPEGDGYLVTCPKGCALGLSAHQPNEDGAKRRVEMHRVTTEPLRRSR